MTFLKHFGRLSQRNKGRQNGVVAALLSLVLFLSAACSSGPPPRLYLLEQPLDVIGEERTESTFIRALGISQVTVPGYASDARIASRRSNGVVVQIDDQRWAEEPEDAITRLLAEQLRVRADATVLVEPWPRDYDPQARIEVMIDRLLREPDGGAHLSGHVYLISSDGRRLLETIAFDERRPAPSLESTEFFRAVALIIDQIAGLSINALEDVMNPS